MLWAEESELSSVKQRLWGWEVGPSCRPWAISLLGPDSTAFMQHLLCAWPCPAHCFTEEDSHIQAKTWEVRAERERPVTKVHEGTQDARQEAGATR